MFIKMSTTTEQDTQTTRKRKTVRLTGDEKKALNKKAKKYDTQEDLADAIGMNRGTLLRIMELGRGSEDNIVIIREWIGDIANVA